MYFYFVVAYISIEVYDIWSQGCLKHIDHRKNHDINGIKIYNRCNSILKYQTKNSVTDDFKVPGQTYELFIHKHVNYCITDKKYL